MGGKVEKDIWGCVAVLADAFGEGNPAVEEAAAQARKFAGQVPEASAKKSGEVELKFCEACQAHHVDGAHSVTGTIPASPAPPAKKSGQDVYCVYDSNCNFLQPYRSANAAMQAAKQVNGYVKVMSTTDLPEDT